MQSTQTHTHTHAFTQYVNNAEKALPEINVVTRNCSWVCYAMVRIFVCHIFYTHRMRVYVCRMPCYAKMKMLLHKVAAKRILRQQQMERENFFAYKYSSSFIFGVGLEYKQMYLKYATKFEICAFLTCNVCNRTSIYSNR